MFKSQVIQDKTTKALNYEKSYKQVIEEYNKFVKRKIKHVSEILNIPLEKYAPKDIKGKTRMLGLFDDDGHYKEFITQGAKKYAYEDKDGLHITISGVKKEPGAKEMGDIKKFTPNYIFKHSAGQVAYYEDSDIHYEEIDGYKFLTASGVALYDSTYELHAPDYWLEYLHSFGGMIYD